MKSPYYAHCVTRIFMGYKFVGCFVLVDEVLRLKRHCVRQITEIGVQIGQVCHVLGTTVDREGNP